MSLTYLEQHQPDERPARAFHEAYADWQLEESHRIEGPVTVERQELDS